MAGLALLFAAAAASGAVAGLAAGGRLPAAGKTAGSPAVAARPTPGWPATPPADEPPVGAAGPGQIDAGELPTDREALTVSLPAARLRELLALDGIDAVDPTDRELVEFGNVLCLIAALEDPDGFADYRDRLAIEHGADNGTDPSTADPGLSPTDVSAAVDAGLTAFCPDQAARLGISG